MGHGGGGPPHGGAGAYAAPRDYAPRDMVPMSYGHGGEGIPVSVYSSADMVEPGPAGPGGMPSAGPTDPAMGMMSGMGVRGWVCIDGQ
jgi:hypothetical protein